MGDLDADTLADAARRYSGLRRRYWPSLLGFGALLGGLMLFHMVEVEVGPLLLDPVLRGVLIVPVASGALACWVVGALAHFALMRFRCPRCRKRGTVSWFSPWSTNRCEHCGLDLGPAAMATAKPLFARPEPLSSKAGIWDREFDGNP